MSHKYFTHKDALRQEIPHVEPPSPEVVGKVRKVIAAHSDDGEECRQFLDMLGLLPESES